MILDANLLLFAADSGSPFHERARSWLDATLQGGLRVGLPWQTLGAFMRVGTNPRLFAEPLAPAEAWDQVASWVSLPTVWIPPATERTLSILGRLIMSHSVTGDLMTDAQLAALAIEHGVVLYSADTDFARFDELRWENPLTGG